MGGYGSGSRSRFNAKQTTSDLLDIDIRQWH